MNNLVDEIVQSLTAQSNSGFPVEAFPDEVADVVRHYVEVKQFPVDYFATAVLSAFSSTIGRSCTLKAGPYIATANVFAMIVGAPGVNKSSAITSAYAPIYTYQQQQHEEYLQEWAAWKVLSKEEREETPEPVFSLMVLNNTTMEALVKALAASTKGCSIVADELAGWVKSLNQYRAGGDMEDYLSAWIGAPIIKSRVSGNVFVKSSLLTIIGTIQPAVLDQVSAGKEDNGFLDRFLFAFPDGVKKPYPRSVYLDPVIEGKYKHYITRLLSLDGPIELEYTQTSSEIIERWVRANIDKQNATEEDAERAIRAKYDIYIHRLALIMQMMQYAVSGYDNDCTRISDRSAQGATQLADYFLSMAEKIRLKPKSELLSGKWKEVFDMLPIDQGEFSTSDFLGLTASFEINERTAKRWIKAESENPAGVITRLRHGIYAAKN